jgi:hypothetical protein
LDHWHEFGKFAVYSEYIFMKRNTLVYSLVTTLLLTASSLSAAKVEIPEVSVDGLHHVKDSKLALVYAQPGVDFGQYQRVYLADTYVAFKKNWQRSQNRSGSQRVSAGDMEKIKIELASLFRQVFTETLEEGGYELVTERAEDVLIIKPAIINLYIVAPDVSAGISHTYTESAGEMTLYLELSDSVTDDVIAKAYDRALGRETGYFEWRNRGTNRAAAKRILKVWANVLKEGLDEAKAIRLE